MRKTFFFIPFFNVFSHKGGNGPETCGNVTSLIGFLTFAKTQIPDMAFTIVEQVAKKNVVTVRGEWSGTPQTAFGPFTGVQLATPKKAFKIMTIDVHHIKDKKIAIVHHIEDWLTARAQISA